MLIIAMYQVHARVFGQPGAVLDGLWETGACCGLPCPGKSLAAAEAAEARPAMRPALGLPCSIEAIRLDAASNTGESFSAAAL